MQEEFREPRLAALYDALAGARVDLDAYAALAEDRGARSALDVGCGTGVLALRLAAAGVAVTAVDPAPASLAIARAKPGAGAVTWVEGDVHDVPPQRYDLVLLTGNTAQQLVDDDAWFGLLRATRRLLAPDGRLVLESRDPAAREWEEWTPARTRRTTALRGAGSVVDWTETTRVELPTVSFRSTWSFDDGAVLTSDSVLRFRDEAELRHDLEAAGFAVDAVTGAADRPGRELVVTARPAG